MQVHGFYTSTQKIELFNRSGYVKNLVARLLYLQKMEEKRSLKQLLYAKIKFC